MNIKSLLFFSFTTIASLATAQSYDVQFMGMSRTTSLASPLRINDNGQVAGEFMFLATGMHGFRWTNGVAQDLGTLGGVNGQTSNATGINNSGVVVGYSDQNGAAFTTRGFTFANSMVEVPPIDGRDTYLSAINNSGIFVGAATKTQGSSQWLLPAWQKNGVFTRLPVLHSLAAGNALAINDSNVVVGVSDKNDGQSHAVRWVNGAIQDLGYLAGQTNARPVDIDSQGRILVQQNGALGAIASLWENGVYQNLGDLGTFAMNDSGYIVGNKFNGNFGGFVRLPDGTIVDLEPLMTPVGLTFFQAMDINNAGQIVGVARRLDSNVNEYIILNPVLVPEPATLAVMGFGAMALLRRRRKGSAAK